MLSPADVPPFKVYYPTLAQMDSAQRAFYERLRHALDAGTKVDVIGNVSYLFVYAYELLGDWEGKGFQFVHDGLHQLERLYPEEPKFAEGCRLWTLDCLLGNRQFDAYLDATLITDAADAFRKATHPSNLRLNVTHLAGRPADAVDLVRISAFRPSAAAKKAPAAFVDCLRLVFETEAERHGPWLQRCLSMEQLAPYDETLFQGAPIRQPKAPFQIYSFYSVRLFLDEITAAARAAQAML